MEGRQSWHVFFLVILFTAQCSDCPCENRCMKDFLAYSLKNSSAWTGKNCTICMCCRNPCRGPPLCPPRTTCCWTGCLPTGRCRPSSPVSPRCPSDCPVSGILEGRAAVAPREFETCRLRWSLSLAWGAWHTWARAGPGSQPGVFFLLQVLKSPVSSSCSEPREVLPLIRVDMFSPSFCFDISLLQPCFVLVSVVFVPRLLQSAPQVPSWVP